MNHSHRLLVTSVQLHSSATTQRMINDCANHKGSEIWDAQIRGIVQLHKEQSSDGIKDQATGGASTLDLEKKVYYPISLSPDSHPHFSRIWYARHVLNAESPLLKREIRDMIVKDGGKWDKGRWPLLLPRVCCVCCVLCSRSQKFKNQNNQPPCSCACRFQYLGRNTVRKFCKHIYDV